MKDRIISFSPPDIGEDEIAAVTEVLKSGWITTGPRTKEFEQKIAEYIGYDKAVCLNSATAALELSLRILGIGKGDEVITSAYTYTASASVICHIGATPVLVDVKKDGYQMDLEQLSSAITSKTKAIIPVEIAGVPCDYDGIFKVIDAKKALFSSQNENALRIGRIALVVDAAHSFGARYKNKPCNLGDFTCYSFHAVKNLTTGEGGAVAFSNTNGKDVDKIYKEYMLLSLHGQTKDALSKTQLGSWEYDIVSPAFKCNMTDLMAAIGLSQLKRYDSLLSRRHEIVAQYDEAFKGTCILPLPHFDENCLSSCHLYITNLVGKTEGFRNDVIKQLANLGISANVHYKPLPLLTAYKNMGFDISNYPNAHEIYKTELTLPLHTMLDDLDVEYIIENIIQVVK